MAQNSNFNLWVLAVVFALIYKPFTFRSQNITEKIQQVKEASEPLQKKSIGPSEVGGAKSAHKQTGDGNTLMAKKKITGSTTSSSTGTLTRVEIEHRNDHPLDMDAPEQSVFQDD